MAVGSGTLAEEVGLSLCHLAETVAGGVDLEGIDGIEELFATQPTELLTGESVGKPISVVWRLIVLIRVLSVLPRN